MAQRHSVGVTCLQSFCREIKRRVSGDGVFIANNRPPPLEMYIRYRSKTSLSRCYDLNVCHAIHTKYSGNLLIDNAVVPLLPASMHMVAPWQKDIPRREAHDDKLPSSRLSSILADVVFNFARTDSIAVDCVRFLLLPYLCIQVLGVIMNSRHYDSGLEFNINGTTKR